MGSNPNDSPDRDRSESDGADSTADTTTTTTTANEQPSQGESHSSSIANSARERAGSEQSSGGTGQAAGQAAGRALDSARDRLSSPAAKSQLKYVIGLFALVGIGFGTTGFLIIELIASGVAGSIGGGGGGGAATAFVMTLFALPLLVVVLLIGPVIAVYSGLNARDGLYQEPRTAYLTNFVGNLTGYLVMVAIAVLLVNAAFGGGGGTTAQTGQAQVGGGSSVSAAGGNTFNIADLVVPIIVLSIPVGLVGFGSAYLHGRRNVPDQTRTPVSS